MKQKKPNKLDIIEKKLDKVLKEEEEQLKKEEELEKLQKEELKEEGIVENLEKKQYSEEKRVENLEKRQIEELQILEQIEKGIKKEVKTHPLVRITLKDVSRGIIGAFIGVAVHYTFTYGVDISRNLNFTRATILFILSLFIGLIFLYATGYRKIKEPKLLLMMPVRLLALYAVSIWVSLFVLFLFYPGFIQVGFEQKYAQLAAVLLPAIVGACTADLIGRD